jgi:hypothetical protein
VRDLDRPGSSEYFVLQHTFIPDLYF